MRRGSFFLICILILFAVSFSLTACEQNNESEKVAESTKQTKKAEARYGVFDEDGFVRVNERHFVRKWINTMLDNSSYIESDDFHFNLETCDLYEGDKDIGLHFVAADESVFLYVYGNQCPKELVDAAMISAISCTLKEPNITSVRETLSYLIDNAESDEYGNLASDTVKGKIIIFYDYDPDRDMYDISLFLNDETFADCHSSDESVFSSDGSAKYSRALSFDDKVSILKYFLERQGETNEESNKAYEDTCLYFNVTKDDILLMMVDENGEVLEEAE